MQGMWLGPAAPQPWPSGSAQPATLSPGVLWVLPSHSTGQHRTVQSSSVPQKSLMLSFCG